MTGDGQVRLTKTVYRTANCMTERGPQFWTTVHFRITSSDKRSETGPCSRPYPIQDGVRCHASRCFTT